MIKAAIFDLDGTLADTIESIATASNEVLEKFGLPPQPVEKYNYYAGDGAKTLVERALYGAGDTKLQYLEEAYEAYKTFFASNCTYKVKVFEGLKETLDQMKANGIKLGVLTNKPHDRGVEVVEYLFGKGYFTTILGEQPAIPKKPSNVGALRIAKEFSVAPEECLYVGDTNVDMITGKSANMYTIGVLWGFRTREELEQNNADAIIQTPEELLQYVRKE